MAPFQIIESHVSYLIAMALVMLLDLMKSVKTFGFGGSKQRHRGRWGHRYLKVTSGEGDIGLIDYFQ
jgi:hypothetical protein